MDLEARGEMADVSELATRRGRRGARLVRMGLLLAAAAALALGGAACASGTNGQGGGGSASTTSSSTSGVTTGSSSSGTGGMGVGGTGTGGTGTGGTGTGGMGVGGIGGMGAGGMGAGGTGAGGAGGMGAGGAGGMGAGGMGAGGAGGCAQASECPPTGLDCVIPSCKNGQCGTADVAAGTATPNQTKGDCKNNVCDGAGMTVVAADDPDLPDDGNACTNDLCNGGVPSHSNVAANTNCGPNLICDGNGSCTGCVTFADCPGQDTECKQRACTAGACGVTFTAAGTLLASQTAGDCQVKKCDGNGGVASTADPTDPPIDGNACTADQCNGGVPANPPLAAGAPCGNMVCDGAGVCVECVSAANCSSGVCVSHVCETCTDAKKNGTETGLDCGGSACPACSAGETCLVAADCKSALCQAGVCKAASVVGTTPANGATGVAETSAIAVIFDTAMSPASLIAQTTAGACAGTIQVSTDDFVTCLSFAAAAPIMTVGNTIATLVSAPGLSYGSTYRVRVTTGATDAGNGPLGIPYSSASGFTTGLPATSCNGSIVISQIYGAGGNVGASFKNDYIELHNRGGMPVSLAGWSVQYASAASASWSKTDLAGSIAPGGYFLVQEAGGAVGAALPMADLVAPAPGINMAATAGKVALVGNATLLTIACPAGGAIVDFAGYGASASCFEGAGPTPAPSTTLSATRAGAGCTDTDQNGTNFNAVAAAPRNASSPAVVCSCGGDRPLNETGQGPEMDYCVIQSPQTTITVAASGTTPLIYGRVYEAAVTDPPGPAGSITAQVGYGPATSNPEWQAGWKFFPAAFNAQYGNDDEYMATLTAPAAPGAYLFAYRFSTNGVDWTYCDVNGAGQNPSLIFETTQLPSLNVTP